MTRTRLLAPFLSLLGAAVLGAAPADAQREGYSYLSFVGPDVTLASHDEEDTTARVNMPIVAGDRISTGRGSRAEAILADGTVVRFDARTDARFDRMARTYQSDDDRTLIALTSGALAVETERETDEDRAIRIDTDDATVVVPERGVVRVDTGHRGTEVYVLSGSAEVMARSGRSTVREGESAYVTGSDPIDVASSDLPRDRFTQFIEERGQRPRGDSLRRLEEARAADGVDDATWDDDSYGAAYDASLLDDSGSWVYADTYNRWCWRPSVAVDWTPYSLGYWRWTPCGLTWVSYEPWGWMPYHYGSWFLDASFGWCWSPGWAYSPAWVYWNYTPSWTGWCPMGYYGWNEGWWGAGGPVWHGGRFEWSRYPHFRGRIDVTRMDRRGWNYVNTNRLGGRFERGDVLRGDRVPFRAGDTGVIATSPLRVERTAGVSVRTAVQDAVRRVPAQFAGRGVDAGLTQVLRRERTLPREGRETLSRSFTTVGRDAAYRPLRAEQIASGRLETTAARDASRFGSRAATPGGPGSGRVDPWRSGRSDGRVVGDARGSGTRVAPGSDWRSGAGARPGVNADRTERFRRDDSGWRSARGTAAPRSPAAEGRSDSGWRSPRVESTPRGATPRRDDSSWRSGRDAGSAPRRFDSPRSADTPRRDDSGWRAPAPRSEPPRRDSRSFDSPRFDRPAPPSRGWDRGGDRPAPPSRGYSSSAPRGYDRPSAPPARSYEPPARSYAPPARSYAPPARSFEAPRSFSAPRFEAPRSAPAPSAPRGGGRR